MNNKESEVVVDSNHAWASHPILEIEFMQEEVVTEEVKLTFSVSDSPCPETSNPLDTHGSRQSIKNTLTKQGQNATEKPTNDSENDCMKCILCNEVFPDDMTLQYMVHHMIQHGIVVPASKKHLTDVNQLDNGCNEGPKRMICSKSGYVHLLSGQNQVNAERSQHMHVTSLTNGNNSSSHNQQENSDMLDAAGPSSLPKSHDTTSPADTSEATCDQSYDCENSILPVEHSEDEESVTCNFSKTDNSSHLEVKDIAKTYNSTSEGDFDSKSLSDSVPKSNKVNGPKIKRPRGRPRKNKRSDTESDLQLKNTLQNTDDTPPVRLRRSCVNVSVNYSAKRKSHKRDTGSVSDHDTKQDISNNPVDTNMIPCDDLNRSDDTRPTTEDNSKSKSMGQKLSLRTVDQSPIEPKCVNKAGGSSPGHTLDADEYIKTITKSSENPRDKTVCKICLQEVSNDYIKDHIKRIHKSMHRHQCDICGKGYFKRNDLRNHLNTHTKEKTFSCNKCPAVFLRKSLFNRHLKNNAHKSKHAVNIAKCDQCETEFKTGNSERTKCYKCTRESECKIVVRCDACGDTFLNSWNLSDHIHRMHPGDPAYKCDICGEMFSSLEACREHKSKQHAYQDYIVCDQCGNVYVTEKSEETKCGQCGRDSKHGKMARLKCHLCDKVFQHRKSLRVHLLIHKRIYDYSCEECGKSFVSQGYLAAHIKYQHRREKKKKNILCEICSFQFDTRTKLQNHMFRKHSTIKSFVCECGACFAVKSDLQIHKRIHTGEKPYKCKHCDQAFSRYSSRHKHIQTNHTDVRNYKCDICCKDFKCSRNLRQHKLVHSDDRPFKCSICGFAFKRKQKLRDHQRTHTGEKRFLCTLCGKGLGCSKALRKHMAWHDKLEMKTDSQKIVVQVESGFSDYQLLLE